MVQSSLARGLAEELQPEGRVARMYAVLAITEGSALTFEEFYQAEYPAMVKAVAVLTRHREEAEDAVQEAFYRACRDWAKLSEHPAPTAWLHLTASRIAIGRWRQWRQRISLFEHEVVDSGVDQDLRLQIFGALRQLDPASRTVVYLHYFADLSVDSVASLVGKPPGTVKSMLHRARHKLEGELAQ